MLVLRVFVFFRMSVVMIGMIVDFPLRPLDFGAFVSCYLREVMMFRAAAPFLAGTLDDRLFRLALMNRIHRRPDDVRLQAIRFGLDRWNDLF